MPPGSRSAPALPVAQERLLARVRGHLHRRGITAPVRETSMFGVRAVMLGDAMLAAAGADGSLLARVLPSAHEELLARPGSSQAEMGAGRSMGAGWITVRAETLEDDAVLGSWLDAALDRHPETAAD